MSSSGDMTLSLSDRDIEDILESKGKGLSKSELYNRILTESSEPTELLQWESKQVKQSSASSAATQAINHAESFLDELDEGIKNQIRFFLSIAESEGVSSRDVGRYLQERKIGSKPDDMSLLSYVKSRHGNLFAFLSKFPSIFQLNTSISKGTSEYLVGLVSDELNDDDEYPATLEKDYRDGNDDSVDFSSNDSSQEKTLGAKTTESAAEENSAIKESAATGPVTDPPPVSVDSSIKVESSVDAEKPKKRATRKKKKAEEEK